MTIIKTISLIDLITSLLVFLQYHPLPNIAEDVKIKIVPFTLAGQTHFLVHL